MDCIRHGLSPAWLRSIFDKVGRVADVFISRRIRKFSKETFGFVRFRTLQEAKFAIEKLHDFQIRGRNLQVSLARYYKGGAAILNQTPKTKQLGVVKKKITNPAFRDHRKYSEALMGKHSSESKKRREGTTIPINFTINAAEDIKLVSMLEQAIIVENTEPLNIEQTVYNATAASETIKCMFLLSPTKLLVVYDCIDDAKNAVSVDSALWDSFDNVRLWSEGEMFDDRLVWVECFGIHPKCWSEENMRLIGQKWGPVLCVENRIGSLQSLTYARMLIRTREQNKIDARIKLIFEHGSCDVWVKEGLGPTNNHTLVSKTDATAGTMAGGEGIAGEYGQEVIGTVTLKASRRALVDTRLPDPLVPEIINRMEEKVEHAWHDPIVSNESVVCSSNPPQDCRLNLTQTQTEPPSRNTLNLTPSSQLKTPRGRPKKLKQKQCVNHEPSQQSARAIVEAQETWNIAKLVGISPHDEEAVMSGIRKSKRLLILEGNAE